MHSRAENIIVVLGSMRSGSTVLRQLIASADRATDLGEIFNDDFANPTNFWGYINKASVEQDRFMHPHNWNEAWREYIDKQAAYLDAPVLCVDAKISCLDIIYRPFTSHPRFFFDGPDMRYILLHRNNLLAQAISLHNAYRTDRWAIINDDPARGAASRFHMTFGEQPSPRIIHEPNVVDPDQILNTMRYIREQYSLLRHALIDVDFEEILYETMFDENGLFAENTLGAVARLSGVPTSGFDPLPALKKQGSADILSDVVNAQELVTAIRASEFGYTVDHIPPCP